MIIILFGNAEIFQIVQTLDEIPQTFAESRLWTEVKMKKVNHVQS